MKKHLDMSPRGFILFCFIFCLVLAERIGTDDINQIMNGDFQSPSFSGTSFVTTESLFSWEERLKNDVKFVKAAAFNSMYPSSAQALAIGPNSRVYQKRTLQQKQWELSFSVALAVNSLTSTYNFTSHLRVFWNDQLIFDINPTAPTIQYVKTRVKSKNGSNTIEFAGTGNQDCDLIDILVDDVTLVQIFEVKVGQVYAGLSGSGKVTFSTYLAWLSNGRIYNYNNYLLDYIFPQQMSCWQPTINKYGQWIQISTEKMQQWIAIVTQGRYDDWEKGNKYVKTYKISYTTNGLDWTWAQKGRIFQGNSQGTIKQRRNFAQPIYARGIRLYPVQWQNAIGLRFDAIFKA